MESTPRASAQTETWIALLGRRDNPTDGVEDYCTFLGDALSRRGVELRKTRVEWMDRGWFRALWRLRRESSERPGAWVLLQYTALGWSRRGFPVGALAALAMACRRGTHAAVVFHEPFGIEGPRGIDKLRCACQNWIVRQLYRRAEKSILTMPLKVINWLPKADRKAVFIPIGANIPERATLRAAPSVRNGRQRTVAVFCVDPPPYREQELDDIARAVIPAAMNGAPVRILFFGKGTVEATEEIERAFRETAVEVSILGLLGPDDIRRSLAESDVLLSVRGTVYPRRGSAIAGIACGLPVVGYTDGANIYPISEAGLRLVPRDNQTALANALADVLHDPGLHGELSDRSSRAHAKYFAWDVIAEQFRNALDKAQE